jgi:hypothetical protein
MAFLATLADIGESARRSRMKLYTCTVAESLSQQFPPQSSARSHVLLGKWEMDKANRTRYERFLADIGYPWFVRQIIGRAMSCVKLAFSLSNVEGMGTDEVLSLSAAGSFMGYTFENINERFPPLMFPAKVASDGPKWRSVGRPPTNTSIAKTCYRFVNTHVTIANQDGSCFTEVMQTNPKLIFAAESMKVFDVGDMKRWVDNLHDADPASGLPKQMQKAAWGRWVTTFTRTQRNGRMYLDYKIDVYDYDSSTDYWSRLLATLDVSLSREET